MDRRAFVAGTAVAALLPRIACAQKKDGVARVGCWAWAWGNTYRGLSLL